MSEDVNRDVPELVPARMLNEYTYCPRFGYLEWVNAEFEESHDTVKGKTTHRRVDERKGKAPDPDDANEEETFHARSVYLSGEKIGLVTIIDVMEGEGKVATPVDYKKGKAPDIAEGAWEPDRVQLCAQALVLRENGYECEEGIVYYAGSKRRVPVDFDDILVKRTVELIREFRECVSSGVIPPPLTDSPKCPRCSLVGICLPDEVSAMGDPGSDRTDVRRLVPARDDALPVYVMEQGTTIGKSGDRLDIRKGRMSLEKVRLMETSQLATFGNVSVTPQALHTLCQRGIPVCHFSYGGWFYGITHGMSHKNVELRIKQYELASDPSRSLIIARGMIEAKVANCRTFLRRNLPDKQDVALDELSVILSRVKKSRSLEKLRGLEGAAAQVYFSRFGRLIKTDDDQNYGFDFTNRNRRPPVDPVNSMLSYVYAMLVKDVTVTLLAVGFDPYLGFLHSPKYGRPAMALDLMEEFRPLICDSTVVRLINNREVKETDFTRRAGAVTMSNDCRKKVVSAFEARLDTTITHPIFGYKISYRRVLEVQARLIGRYLSGEIPEYPGFMTR